MSGYRWLKAIPYYNNNSPKLETLRLSYDHKMDYNTLEFDIPDELINTVQERTGLPLPFVTGIRLYGYLPVPAAETKTFVFERREKNLRMFSYLHLCFIKIDFMGLFIVHVGLGGWDDREKVTNAAEALEYIERLKPVKPLPQWVYKLMELMATENVPCRAEYLRYRKREICRFFLFLYADSSSFSFACLY